MLGSISIFICYFNHLMLTKMVSLRIVEIASRSLHPRMKPLISPISKFSPTTKF